MCVHVCMSVFPCSSFFCSQTKALGGPYRALVTYFLFLSSEKGPSNLSNAKRTTLLFCVQVNGPGYLPFSPLTDWGHGKRLRHNRGSNKHTHQDLCLLAKIELYLSFSLRRLRCWFFFTLPFVATLMCFPLSFSSFEP